MKIKLDKEELVSKLQIVQNLISQRATLPVLSNYLIETDANSGKLWITSTNLEIGIRTPLSANVLEGGSITIPAKKLGEIIHNLPSNGSAGDVEIRLLENNRIQVIGAKSRFQLVGIPKEDYPVLPEFQNKTVLEISAKTLVRMIEKTICAVSADETRYVLNGILFTVSNGVASMVATDGRRLAVVSEPGLLKTVSIGVIVPAKAFSEVVKVAYHCDKDLKASIFIDITENQIGFRIGETLMFSRLIEGNFPNWEQVIPKKEAIVVRADREKFLSVTRRAALCITDRAGTCRYKFFKDRCQVSSKTAGHYEFEEEADLVSYSGPEGFEIAFNPGYVTDFLKTVAGDAFEIYLSTSVNPVLFRSEGESPQYNYVVMPMRTQSS